MVDTGYEAQTRRRLETGINGIPSPSVVCFPISTIPGFSVALVLTFVFFTPGFAQTVPSQHDSAKDTARQTAPETQSAGDFSQYDTDQSGTLSKAEL
ncbi:MAG: hypothetical protein ACPHF4_06020, partial [Rubripirellula sp.]